MALSGEQRRLVFVSSSERPLRGHKQGCVGVRAPEEDRSPDMWGVECRAGWGEWTLVLQGLLVKELDKSHGPCAGRHGLESRGGESKPGEG